MGQFEDFIDRLKREAEETEKSDKLAQDKAKQDARDNQKKAFEFFSNNISVPIKEIRDNLNGSGKGFSFEETNISSQTLSKQYQLVVNKVAIKIELKHSGNELIFNIASTNQNFKTKKSIEVNIVLPVDENFKETLKGDITKAFQAILENKPTQ